VHEHHGGGRIVHEQRVEEGQFLGAADEPLPVAGLQSLA
jgi:hypothetical protein